jgi:putative tryptophan/tyrosine transport system substrate-binding protein
VLVNPADAARAESISQNVEAAARVLGLQIAVLNASTAGEIDAVFASLARERADALLIGADPFFNSRRVQLATLAARHAIPSASGGRDGTEAGLLVSYGTSVADILPRAKTRLNTSALERPSATAAGIDLMHDVQIGD